MDSTMNSAILGILIPFAGTSLGAACVYAMRGELNHQVQRGLTGFASGVMIAASIWSLLIPAMEESAHLGKFGFVPAVVGFWLGIFLLLALDRLVPHLHMYSEQAEGPHSHLQRTTMLVLAVTLHNIPEGMAVGVTFAGVMTENSVISLAGALALSIGIAIQNFPEGAIISMPLQSHGLSKGKAFLYGAMSGIVEPIAAVITIFLTGIAVPLLPYLFVFCGRSHDLCRCRRTHSRISGRRTFQYRNDTEWRQALF